MLKALKKYYKKNNPFFKPTEKNVVEAYNLWAENYDLQPKNLMLFLDAIIFKTLLNKISLKTKAVADIGCGTGRHWDFIYSKETSRLSGFDVSPGMLNILTKKYPEADVHVITDNEFLSINNQTFDVIVSTLTVAHIKNLEQALAAWNRILKLNGDIIITDFHPDALAIGGKRTFVHKNKQLAVNNFVHSTALIKKCMLKLGFEVIEEIVRYVDDDVKHFYEEQDAMHVYEKFEGKPIIYGLHFQRKA